MKAECNKEKLRLAVASAERITGKHMTLPVLSCILIKAVKGKIAIRATNLDLGIEIEIQAEVTTEGSVAVSGAVLAQLLSAADDSQNITLESVSGNLRISTKTTSSVIKAQPSEDFPNIPKITDANECFIDAKEFAKGVRSVVYSASVSTVKPELSSVYIYSEDDNLVFVATDSFRLAEKKMKVKRTNDISPVLIPNKNVVEISRILEHINEYSSGSAGKDGNKVKFLVNKNQISIDYNGISLVSRVIDGVYPDYRQIFPKTKTTQATMLKQDLIDAFRLSTIFSDKFNQVNIQVSSNDSVVKLTTKNNDIGETSRDIGATVEGEDVIVNFNHKYITDCLQSIDGDSVTFGFSGLNRPLLVTCATDASFTYLVMPMNR